MLRRHALAALTLGGIAGLAACHDALADTRAEPTEPELELDKVPDDGAEGAHIQEHTITGGGGCQLHLVETGSRHGQSILFLHGFSQSILSWSAQLGSELGRRFRLVAMDLRGHGASAKPASGYEDSKLWADDVAAAIQELALDQPILCGWSYGPLVMLDYIRYYGEARVGGLHFVDGISKLGSAAALSVLTPEPFRIVVTAREPAGSGRSSSAIGA